MGRDTGRTSEVPAPGPGGSEALRIEGLRKSFGPYEVLRGVDLDVAPHEVIGLIGASGSGKSTLLRCVNLLERIDAGTIWLDGQAITRPGVDENLVRRHIGIVFQSFNLFPHMTVERNVTLAPMRVLGLPRAEATAQAAELLDRFGLGEKRADYPDRLSGRQQQRVALVRALAMRPRLLLPRPLRKTRRSARKPEGRSPRKRPGCGGWRRRCAASCAPRPAAPRCWPRPPCWP